MNNNSSTALLNTKIQSMFTSLNDKSKVLEKDVKQFACLQQEFMKKKYQNQPGIVTLNADDSYLEKSTMTQERFAMNFSQYSRKLLAAQMIQAAECRRNLIEIPNKQEIIDEAIACLTDAVPAKASTDDTGYAGTTIPRNQFADSNEELVYCLTADIERLKKQL